MAEYIAANKWITGVATHKTKHGPILCTGCGCVGCFPQDFPEIACELEVYDCKTGMLFSESWTNDLSNESAMGTRNQLIKPAKRKHRIKRKNLQNTDFKTCETLFATQASNSPDASTVTGNTQDEFKKLFLTEYEQETEGSKMNFFLDTEKFPTGTNDCCSGKETDSYLSTETLTNHDIFREDARVVDREDCVCLFFALEYNHNSCRLSDFSILEIVSSLTTIMHVNEIKCVQRLNGLWHIVLRTREHLGYLLLNGVRIRGKSYRVVQDNNMYCEKVV